MDNMELYSAFRSPPKEAQKKITGGRLNGKTDINPMWRIKKLTEQFGACGFGWKYEIVNKWTQEGGGGEIAAFCDILLYVKVDGKWSEPIPGTGGSSFVSKERNGFYTSDECYKMALTDAISVACKALGMAADIYWGQDPTKYDRAPSAPSFLCASCHKPIREAKNPVGQVLSPEQVAQSTGGLCLACYRIRSENDGA